jgi:long-chain acyl-CoA synthetase
MPYPTLLDFYRQDADRAIADKYTSIGLTGDVTLSNDEFLARVAALHLALGSFGIAPGDRVAILSDNRAEWHQIDIASLAHRAVTVPIYPTLNAQQVGYHLRDSGSRVVFTEGLGQTSKVVEGLGGMLGDVVVIQIGETPPSGVQSFDALIERHRAGDAVDRFWARAAEVRPEDLATIVYTSGTTGQPKGAMLTHANISSNVLAVLPRTPLKASDHALEFLPLCHIFERTCGYAYMSLGVKRTYCPPALVSENIATIKPTAFASVPRLFEKIHSTIVTKVSQKSGFSQKLFNWSVETGREVARRRLAQEKITGRLAMAHGVAERMVLSKIREAFGGRVRCAFSGGAPLAASLNEFFHAIGIPIQEAYGLTETSPGISANGYEPGDNRIGTVGRPLDGVQVAFTDDGELLVKGPGITQGYWEKPEATEEAFTPEGYFRTGDIASLDASGFLVITDRKKDIIIPAGGKNVAPQPIEQALSENPFVEHAVLIGDRRPYIVALLSPSVEALQSWAQTHGMGGVETAELMREPEVKAMFASAVTTTNTDLGHFETVKKYRVLPQQLTIESGHLTPTMKVKRRMVERDYSTLIEQMYDS